MKSVLSRLTALESKYLQESLVVLGEDQNGAVSRMTVQALIDGGFSFVKVIRGSSLSDLDLLLSAFHARVLQDTEKGGIECKNK